MGAVIAAAGQSTRAGGIDKLFAPIGIGGRPLLAHTLAAFEGCDRVQRVALVVSAANLERARDLVSEYGFAKVAVCAGGARRQDSVRLGLETLGDCEWVAVHDGARPLVTGELIERGLAAAAETGAALAALPVADTVKESDGSTVVRTLDRGRLWLAQTPQVFRRDLLARAHREVTADVTDDAAMVEALGVTVRIFPGSPYNIKVTTAEDLRLAQALLTLESAGLQPPLTGMRSQ